jgi:hypothetical protein
MLEVTFAMNLGWPSNRDECAHPVIHQSTHDLPGNLALYNAVYRPISGDAGPASLHFGATDFQAELEQCTVAWKAHPPDASY